ncbi:MAG: ABC transporter permease subunit [Agathobacter sp.]|nr:ABC transporter permease subunit [Agathobacter sp.]
MKEIIFFELKKLVNIQKIIVLSMVLFLLCVGSFAIICTMGDWKGAGEMLTHYRGSVENNPQIEADVASDDARISEYANWLRRCDEVRKANLAEIGFEAETLVIGNTVFYGFMEEFIANYLPFILGFVIALLIAPVFASEYSNKMDGLLLSSKHGKRTLIIGKFIAAAVVILAVYCFVVGVFGVISLCAFGTGDGNASFVFTADYVYNYFSSPFNFRVWQYMIVLFVCSLLGCIGFGGFVLLVSSKCRSALPASMISLAVIYIPILAFKSLGQNEGVVPNILRLFPGAIMGVRTLFSNYFPVQIGNMTFSITFVSITLFCISSVFFSIFAYRGFQKHQVQN